MSKRKLPRLAALVIVLLIFGERAEGAIIIDVDNFTASGSDEFDEIVFAGPLTGQLTGVAVDLKLIAAENFTWGDDFTILAKLSGITAPALQAGGFSNLDATQRITWANGGSGDPNTIISDTQDLEIPLSASQLSIFIGNGYESGGNGTWDGTFTLLGVNEGATGATAVPEPTSLAIFGIFVAGLLGTRRRK